jgi:hypothetical protein
LIGIKIISLKNGLNRVKMRDIFLPYLQPPCPLLIVLNRSGGLEVR